MDIQNYFENLKIKLPNQNQENEQIHEKLANFFEQITDVSKIVNDENKSIS